MTKALLKKQMMEVFSWIYQDKKTGKLRTGKRIVCFAVLYLVLFGFLGVAFGLMASAVCEPMLSVGMGWFYWCLMGILSVFLGVFGSVFNTYSSLYQAKDNDLLLAMPIPPSRILLFRLLGVYAMGLMYELIVMIPTVFIWLLEAPFSICGTIHVLLIPICLSALILVLSAILGWVIALIAAKVRHKNIMTVIVSLGFIGVYYYICGSAYSLLELVILNMDEIGKTVRIVLFPLYHMGMAAEGSVSSMLLFAAFTAAVTAVVYMILSRSFLHLATVNRGAARAVYKERNMKAGSIRQALLWKEWKRFVGSANYMLNCGLAILLMPLSAAMLIWKAEDIHMVIALIPGASEILPLIAIAAVCMVASMNDMTAPSISLEGKNLWILQSFPIAGKDVLAAKLELHLLLTLFPALTLSLALIWLLNLEPVYIAAMLLILVLYVVLTASFGLLLNLKLPNLNWTSEIVPIKQGLPVMIALFGGWGFLAALAGVYILLQDYIGSLQYLIGVLIVLFAADSLLLHWLMTKGGKRLEELS